MLKERHGDIDEEREDERHGNLEQLDGIEPPPEQHDLPGEECHVDDECRLAERVGIGEAQHVGQARNRRRAEQALDDERDARRLHEDADGEDEIAFPDGQTKTSFLVKFKPSYHVFLVNSLAENDVGRSSGLF